MRLSDWDAMIAELGARGHCIKESGAFLLANIDGDPRLISRVVYFDDLDPKCLKGGIHFDGRAYSKLWDVCKNEKCKVVGDVHTHPGTQVRQSIIDAANPMIAQKGHIALILPDLGCHSIARYEVGIHRYDGGNWTSWTGREAKKRISLRRRFP